MKTEIVPAILTNDKNDFIKKINQVKDSVNFFQVDIVDGVFVANQTINDPKLLNNFPELGFEIHLMVKNPENILDNWLNIKSVKRILVHYESTEKLKEIIERCRAAGREVGIAINPKTGIDAIDKYAKDIDLVLLLAVEPGFYGSKFEPIVFDKIKNLRKKYPDIIIEIDGGINTDNIKELINSGANRLAVGSYIFKSKDPKKSLKELKDIL